MCTGPRGSLTLVHARPRLRSHVPSKRVLLPMCLCVFYLSAPPKTAGCLLALVTVSPVSSVGPGT